MLLLLTARLSVVIKKYKQPVISKTIQNILHYLILATKHNWVTDVAQTKPLIGKLVVYRILHMEADPTYRFSPIYMAVAKTVETRSNSRLQVVFTTFF